MAATLMGHNSIIAYLWKLGLAQWTLQLAQVPPWSHLARPPTCGTLKAPLSLHLIDTSIPRTTVTGRVPAGRLEGPGPHRRGWSTHSQVNQVSEPSPQRLLTARQPELASALRGKSEHWKLSSLVILSCLQENVSCPAEI